MTLLTPYFESAEYGEALWKKLETIYSSSGRHYHTMDHLSQMLEVIRPYENKLINKQAVYLAVWFHDVVYDPHQKDNEEKSADFLRKESLHWTMASTPLRKAEELILLTKSHGSVKESDFDTRLFLDADLAVLGGSKEEYLRYQNGIRMEYAAYPFLLYREGRKKVLKHFLGMDPIYKTEELHHRFEEKAKLNLSMELNQLSL